MFKIETDRLMITEFTPDMAQAVHENSLDEDNRRFVPDEVFETVEDASETIEFLMSRYGGCEGPFVYPVLRKDKTNIGYVVVLNGELLAGGHRKAFAFRFLLLFGFIMRKSACSYQSLLLWYQFSGVLHRSEFATVRLLSSDSCNRS